MMETSLEQRVLALEARVIALENLAAARPQKAKRAKSSDAASFNFGLDLLSLLEDHIEVLKLIHTVVPPADRAKNKLVLAYIRRAEGKLDHFQSRLAQVDGLRKRHAQNPSAPIVKPPRVSLPKLSALNRLLRSASRRGWSTLFETSAKLL